MVWIGCVEENDVVWLLRFLIELRCLLDEGMVKSYRV